MKRFITWLKRFLNKRPNQTEMLNGISMKIDTLQQKLDSISIVVQNCYQNAPIEFLVNLYVQISTRQKDLGISIELANIQTILQHELNRRGVNIHSSLPGTEFDPINMTIAPFPPVLTNNREKENYVANSIVPLFTFKDKNLNLNDLLHKEEVVLYQYSESCVNGTNMHGESGVTEEPFKHDINTSSPIVVGHLILLQYDEISDVYDIYEGCNVYGIAPNKSEGKHCHPIAIASDDMQPEHFEINNHEAKLLSGTWSIDYDGNNVPIVEINNGMKIIISKDLYFVVVEK